MQYPAIVCSRTALPSDAWSNLGELAVPSKSLLDSKPLSEYMVIYPILLYNVELIQFQTSLPHNGLRPVRERIDLEALVGFGRSEASGIV